MEHEGTPAFERNARVEIHMGAQAFLTANHRRVDSVPVLSARVVRLREKE
jgi:hypothetical protein